MSGNKIITPGDLNTQGLKPSEVDPLDFMVSIAGRMKLAEQEIATLRIRLHNAEVNYEMALERISKIENKDVK